MPHLYGYKGEGYSSTSCKHTSYKALNHRKKHSCYYVSGSPCKKRACLDYKDYSFSSLKHLYKGVGIGFSYYLSHRAYR